MRLFPSLTGGADQSKFAIDSSNGNLLFINAPEIEDPSSLSASSNNTYSVQVTATDLSGNTTYQDVVINLLAPAIEGALFEDVTSGTSIGKFVKIKLSHAIDTTASSITDFRNNLTLFDYSDADNRNDLIASDADISFSGNEISIKLTGSTADDSGDLYFEYDDDRDAFQYHWRQVQRLLFLYYSRRLYSSGQRSGRKASC